MYILYKTINSINNKFYIGVHDNSNIEYLGSGVYLKRAIEKYGKENFKRETLFEADKDWVYEIEKFIVDDVFINRSDTYNIGLGGKGGPIKHHSKLAKEKISKANKGKIISKKTRSKLSNAGKEYYKTHDNPRLGITVDDKTKVKMSIFRKKWLNNNESIKHSDETKLKISESNKGRVAWNKGKILSEEHKEKMSNAAKGRIPWNKGKKLSEEHKEKISKAMLAAWVIKGE